MQKFEYYFGICFGHLILHHSDNLSKTLQKTDISASEGQEVAKMTLITLSSLRTEENFEFFWEWVTKTAKDLDNSDPLLPQQRKMPKRYEIGNAQPEFVDTPDHYFKCIYFEALHLITTCISERFDQPGFAVYRNVQDLLKNAAKGNLYQSELEFVLNFYGSDFNDEQLKTQLQVFTANFTYKSAGLFISDIIEYFKSLLPAQLDLFSEVSKLLKLLVMPTTNAVSERSFSTLRRIKTYLRSTMSQSRLNHLMILNIHQELTDGLNLIEVANDFVFEHEHRKQLFGKLKESDLNK